MSVSVFEFINMSVNAFQCNRGSVNVAVCLSLFISRFQRISGGIVCRLKEAWAEG